MSRAMKRKHVFNESIQNYFSPPTDEQEIVRIVSSKGNNLHEVESPSRDNYLVSMPVKFRKNIWVKRGDFVLVDPIKEGEKVKAEMVRVLSKEHIKYFKKINVWPESFNIKFDNDSEDELEKDMNNLMKSSDDSSDSSDSDTDSTENSSSVI
ncbi:PREDICTED: probable RNA-binding protein EIF1AD isoform X2 [Nicrophorus vespilloides]|nr:PREDICTED: probable RNA-binding protein EIF1AD isoform X2 [Nicrophorus vespilloides]